VDPDLVYSIDKRYSDFDKFFLDFKKATKVRCPPLPSKTMILNTHNNLEERGLRLVEWLLLVSNEKMFHNSTFFDFIGLPKSSYNKYLTINPIAHLYNTMDFDLRIKSTEKVKSTELDDKFSLYNIAVTISNKEMKNQVSGYFVKRRYREFFTLH
jgi:PX domain